MAKINEELLQKFDSFQIFMQTAKYTSTPIIVKDKRPQHESSLEYVKALECSESFGNSYISIEVKNGDADHFSAKLMTDEISSKILLTEISQVSHPHALKGQKLLAQGIALGYYVRNPVAL